MSLTQSPVSMPCLTEQDLTNLDVLPSPQGKRTGTKMTIADVAREAGVSTTAVSHAFSGKGRIPDTTRQIIFETAKRLGYEANYYAQRIKGGCTKTIACFTDTITGVAGEKVTRIQQEFNRRGFSVPVHGLGHGSALKYAEAMNGLRRQRPRAIIYSGSRDKGVLDELRRFRDDEGIVVCYDLHYPPDFEQVNLDRELGAYQATRHLIEHGHRAIGISTHEDKQTENSFTQGFRRALKEAGLPYRADWHCPFHPFELAGKTLAAHFAAMSDRPTGFYIVDDRVAASFVTYSLRGGLEVPGDISVVTHDQSGMAEHCMVPITIINHPTTHIVDSVVAMVQSRMEGNYEGPPRHAVICGSLVERSSVRTIKI